MIGCYQVLSILFPGLSRSAATIIGGLAEKLDRRTAAEFSFFLAVPTMLAASVKSLWDVHKTNPEVFVKDNMSLLAVGSLVAFIVAFWPSGFSLPICKGMDSNYSDITGYWPEP